MILTNSKVTLFVCALCRSLVCCKIAHHPHVHNSYSNMLKQLHGLELGLMEVRSLGLTGPPFNNFDTGSQLSFSN